MGRRSVALSLALVALVCVAVVKAAPPNIAFISPQAGATAGNTLVTIVGMNLNSPAVTGVTFDGIAGTSVTVVNPSTVTVRTPAHAAGLVNVVITNADGSTTLTNAFNYTDDPPPTISSYTPTTGTTVGGTAITITGTNFRDNATVTLGGNMQATNVVVVNSTTITARTPANVGGGALNSQLRVVNSDFTSAAAGVLFAYTPFCGGAVTDNCLEPLEVNGGAAPAGVTALLSTGAGGGGFQVSLVNNNNGPNRFELSPAVAPTDEVTVTLRVSAYDPVMALSTGDIQDQGFLWNGSTNVSTLVVKPRNSSWANGGVGCQVPPGACAERATVDYTSFALMVFGSGAGSPPALLPNLQGMYMSTNAQTFSRPQYNGSTGALNFVVGAPSRKFADTDPSDDNDDGDPEADGDRNSQGFFNFFVPDAFIINVWGIADPTVLVSDPSRLRVAIGDDVITPTVHHVNATATSPAGKKIGFSPFGYSTHLVSVSATTTVTAVSPSVVRAGITTNVTIHGVGFLPGATVTIGDVAATNVSVVNGTSITATAPALPVGAKPVVVTNTDATTGTLLNGLMYADCGFTLSSPRTFFGPGAGAGSVGVTTFDDCQWGVTSGASWIVIAGSGLRTGPGTADFTVAPNTTGAARSATVFIAGRPFVVRQAPAGPAAGDMDGDGGLDLLLWHQPSGAIAAWFMDGARLIDGRLFNPGGVGDTNWRPVGMGDFDGDGDNDVLWQHTNRSLAVWFMDGTERTDVQFLNPAQLPANWTVRAVADLNADGWPDLVIQHVTQGFIAVWLMNGLTVEDGTLLSVPQVGDLNWQVVGAGDFNGDGRTDLAWQRADGFIAVWYMDGPTRLEVEFFTPNRINDPAWRIRGVGDVNRDGKPDLLLQHASSGEMAVWLMDGRTLSDGRLFSPARPLANGWLLVGPR